MTDQIFLMNLGWVALLNHSLFILEQLSGVFLGCNFTDTDVILKADKPKIGNQTVKNAFKWSAHPSRHLEWPQPAFGDPRYLITRADVYQSGFQKTEMWSEQQVEHFWRVKCAERREELIHASCRRSSCWPVTSGWSRATLGPAGPRAAKQPNHCGTGKRRPASSRLLLLANYTYQSSQDAMCNYQLRLSTA